MLPARWRSRSKTWIWGWTILDCDVSGSDTIGPLMRMSFKAFNSESSAGVSKLPLFSLSLSQRNCAFQSFDRSLKPGWFSSNSSGLSMQSFSLASSLSSLEGKEQPCASCLLISKSLCYSVRSRQTKPGWYSSYRIQGRITFFNSLSSLYSFQVSGSISSYFVIIRLSSY